MIRRFLPVAATLSILAGGAAQAASDTVTVQGGTVSGSGTVNVAAGNTNQQTNAAVIASGGAASALATVTQSMGDAADFDR